MIESTCIEKAFEKNVFSFLNGLNNMTSKRYMFALCALLIISHAVQFPIVIVRCLGWIRTLSDQGRLFTRVIHRLGGEEWECSI